MKNEEIIGLLRDICPENMQEEWDNSGVQLSFNKEINKILLALEIDSDVVGEAIDNGIDMIITHHPLIFNPLYAIRQGNEDSDNLIKLIDNRISVYSCHTNYDIMTGGINDFFGKLMGITEFSLATGDNPYLRKGILKAEVSSLPELASLLSGKLGLPLNAIRIVEGGPQDKENGNNMPIKTLAWCTGSGAEFMEDATLSGCDCYITGDIKYHDARRAYELGINMIDIGHFGSEKIFSSSMNELLKSKGISDRIELIECQSLKDPFTYPSF